MAARLIVGRQTERPIAVRAMALDTARVQDGRNVVAESDGRRGRRRRGEQGYSGRRGDYPEHVAITRNIQSERRSIAPQDDRESFGRAAFASADSPCSTPGTIARLCYKHTLSGRSL